VDAPAPTPESRLEIGFSRLKLARLLLLGLVMTLVSAAIGFHWLPDIQEGSFKEFIGYVGTLFFGACMVAMLWRYARIRGPVLTVGPEGIRDQRIGPQTIPWPAVIRLSTLKMRRVTFLVVGLEDDFAARFFHSATRRWLRGVNARVSGTDGVQIATQELAVDYNTLFDTCVAFAQKYARDLQLT
jgi:hypothetical protein